MEEITITPEFKKNHSRLSSINVKFLEYVQQHPEWLDKEQFSSLVRWSDNTVIGTLHPWPLFISTQVSQEFAKASVNIFKLVKKILQRHFSFDPVPMSEYYQLPLDLVQKSLYGLNPEQIDPFLARGDFIFTETGLKCLECNVTSSLGGMQSPFWEPLYLKVPLIVKLIEDLQLKIKLKNVIYNLIQHLVGTNLKWYPQTEDLNVAFLLRDLQTKALMSVSGQSSSIDQMYRKAIKEKSNRLEGNVIFCLLEEIYKEGDHLYHKGKRIHTILDNLRGEEIPYEFLEVQKQNNVLIYNGAISQILSSKLNIALLSEHEESQLYSADEREIIKKYIPWTRKTDKDTTTYQGEKIDLKEFVKTHKELFVLKPSQGYGGKGIQIGGNSTPAQWEESVERSFQEKTWVIQERVSIPQLLFQYGESGCVEHDTVWGFYVFGNSFGGTWLRVLPSKVSNGIVNAHKGAKMPIVIEMDQ